MVRHAQIHRTPRCPTPCTRAALSPSATGNSSRLSPSSSCCQKQSGLQMQMYRLENCNCSFSQQDWCPTGPEGCSNNYLPSRGTGQWEQCRNTARENHSGGGMAQRLRLTAGQRYWSVSTSHGLVFTQTNRHRHQRLPLSLEEDRRKNHPKFVDLWPCSHTWTHVMNQNNKQHSQTAPRCQGGSQGAAGSTEGYRSWGTQCHPPLPGLGAHTGSPGTQLPAARTLISPHIFRSS